MKGTKNNMGRGLRSDDGGLWGMGKHSGGKSKSRKADSNKATKNKIAAASRKKNRTRKAPRSRHERDKT